jgi:predicted MFS family arabinose efflux permease
MSNKSLIYISMTVGSFIGGYIPSIWGADTFSLWGVFMTALGGFLGIYIGYKMGQ